MLIEEFAGNESGFRNEEYVAAGAEIVATAHEAWAADMVMKVKEHEKIADTHNKPYQPLSSVLGETPVTTT